MQNIEFIINTLSNKTFAHRLIAKNDIIEILLEVIPYSYTSFFDSRYDDHDFKNLLIDLNATRKSIEEMRQFKTLQRISDEVKLNKSNQLAFKFDIEHISFADSI
jgi:hypothetical protein